jgi:lipid A 3-O-deacylase
MRLSLLAAAAIGCAALPEPAAAASPVAEAHVAVMGHNVRVTDRKNANKESGPNVELGLAFQSPALLKPIGAPKPYVMGSLNVNGNTSFVAVGLQWRADIGGGFAFEPAFGVAWHSAELRNPFPNGDPRATQFSEKNIINSSRDVFHSTLAVSREVTKSTRVQLAYVHLSHGQILGKGRNQGIDQVGLRIVRRFGG